MVLHGDVQVTTQRLPYNYWTEDEVEYLYDNYGPLSARQVADNLNRTSRAIKQKVNELKFNVRLNIYSGYAVAKIFGVTERTIRGWIGKGYIHPSRSGIGCGPKVYVYNFSDYTIKQFIINYSYVYDIRLMPTGEYWTNFAIKISKEHEWITLKEASQYTGWAYKKLSKCIIERKLVSYKIRYTRKGTEVAVIKKKELFEFVERYPEILQRIYRERARKIWQARRGLKVG